MTKTSELEDMLIEALQGIKDADTPYTAPERYLEVSKYCSTRALELAKEMIEARENKKEEMRAKYNSERRHGQVNVNTTVLIPNDYDSGDKS